MPEPVIRDTMQVLIDRAIDKFVQKTGRVVKAFTPAEYTVAPSAKTGNAIMIADSTNSPTTLLITFFTECPGIYESVVDHHWFDGSFGHYMFVYVGRRHLYELRREFSLGPTH